MKSKAKLTHLSCEESVKSYCRIMPGRKSIYAEECFTGSFIGADFGIVQDLTGKLPDEMRAFNREFIPVFLAGHPGKSKIAAGLACGFLWTYPRESGRATSWSTS